VVAPRNSSRLDPSATNSAAAAVRVSFHHETFGDASIADLDFQDGVLSAFKWNN
jgi:hypothetical protein